MTTMTSEEFENNLDKAKEAAQQGPVFITERWRQTHVLLSAHDYQQLVGKRNLLEVLSGHGMDIGEGELELPERTIEPDRDINFP